MRGRAFVNPFEDLTIGSDLTVWAIGLHSKRYGRIPRLNSRFKVLEHFIRTIIRGTFDQLSGAINVDRINLWLYWLESNFHTKSIFLVSTA